MNISPEFSCAYAPNGLAQWQRRDWRDSFSIVVHFWQIAPARKRQSRCPLKPVLGAVIATDKTSNHSE